MAHHRLRSSSGTSSPSARGTNEAKVAEEAPQQQNANQESENNGLHQPASVESLVRRCASCFDETGECNDSEFPRVLFLTHSWFMTSEQLVVLFSQLYEDENTPVEMKKQVFFAIRYWIKEFPRAFDSDATVARAVEDLQRLAANDDHVDSSLIDLSNRGNFKWMRTDRLSVRPPQGAGRKRRKVSLVFHHLEPEELAIHMSYLEFKCFKRLTFEDFHQYAVQATIKDNAKLERSVFLFNNITFWVQCMVLGQHTPQERAAVITKYIKIAQKLREMRNYNTLMAVVGGITHTAIARLKKTMSALTKDSVKALEELVEVLDSRSNYVAYRRDYAQQDNVFKIPIIGIHMKDIIGLHTALSDRVGDGLINVKKMMSIGATFLELQNLQRIPFPHEVNKDLVNTLRVSLYLYYTEEEIYSLSLQREPRDTKSSVSSVNSPSKVNNMVFAEFTKFTCQLDSETVKQHVTAMVESVFKAYDHDNDGFISEEEFNSFTENFPMMESFSAMDVDRDGRISRSEMCDYFMKASAVRRNDFCQNFTHDFVESTYFHPTFCQECEKLLWGLVKQGWKCRGCGINCHKHCKDRIVQECRPKQPTNSQPSQNNSHHLAVKRNGGREKSSVSSESDISANGDVLTAIVGSTPQGQPIDDEAFDSPGELSSSNHCRGSPTVMRRSTSLVSTETTPRRLLRQIHDARTPPPARKASSPENGGGRGSFQRKMKKILPRRNNSNKTREVVDASTQTPPTSPSAVTSQVASNKSFLYPKEPNTTVYDQTGGKQSYTRLGSCGEELDEAQLNNNHIIEQEQIGDVTSGLKGMRVKHHEIPQRYHTVEQLNLTPAGGNSFHHNSFHVSNSIKSRRDSGLSSCSTFTYSELSTPATPILLSDYHSRGSNHRAQPSNLHSSAFKSFPHFTYDDVTSQNTAKSDDDAVLYLQEENLHLRKSNATLQTQLDETRKYLKLLEHALINNGFALPKNERDFSQE